MPADGGARFDAAASEARWQAEWDDRRTFVADSGSAKPKRYILEMFPYPSGRIHMGHVRNYTMGDVLARQRRMAGDEVLHPMGWDAFGMPAENAAMERGVHPEGWTRDNIAAMRAQLKTLGFAIDWSREFATCDASYYGHEQALFLKFHAAGLVERREAYVNWDPVDMTVLANEQVIDGKGWRSGAEVERRKMAQWFLKITDFADELLDGLEELEHWPEKVRTMQANWIGRSRGLKFRFQLENCHPLQRRRRDSISARPGVGTVLRMAKPIPPPFTAFSPSPSPKMFEGSLEVYTTRPDTLYGASFAGIAAGPPAGAAARRNATPPLAAFIADCAKIRDHRSRAGDGGRSAATIPACSVVHPLDNTITLPVFVANFVLMDYGTGAIFGCPAHDQRDLRFRA